MDYVPPGELLQAALTTAAKKADLRVRDMLIRGFLAGGILAYATSLAFMVTTRGWRRLLARCFFLWDS